MNSADIRLTLEKEKIKVSTVRIGRVANSLGFGDDLNYNYTDDEGHQILDAIRADYAAQAQAKTPPQETDQPIGSMPTDESRALTKQAIALTSMPSSLTTKTTALQPTTLKNG